MSKPDKSAKAIGAAEIANQLGEAGFDPLRPRFQPNAKWVCGYQAVGLACSEGPTQDGACCQTKQASQSPSQASTTCELDCSCVANCELAGLRQDPALPSHLDLGPCLPRRSAWYVRQTIGLTSAILTGGLLLLCMALPVREQVLVPGGLSRKHSQILGNRLVADRCSLCHTNAHQDAGMLTQDELCMKCHESHMPDAILRSPHDLNSMQLTRIRPKPATQLISAKLEAATITEELTRCASCHIEHRGQSHQLAFMADARCQACHQEQFNSLAQGHPEFDGFPYRSKRSIAFNHQSHSNKHFAQKDQAFECRTCHVGTADSGSPGPVLRTLGFEEACASCHAESLAAEAVGGWALLQIPSVESQDVSNTAEREFQDWPKRAQFGYDGDVSFIARMLLSSDETARQALEQLPASGSLAKLDPSIRASVTKAIALAMRRLIVDVAQHGQSAWRERLVTVATGKLGRQLNLEENALIDQLSAGLPPDLFRTMVRNWFKKAAGEPATATDAGPAQLASFGGLESGQLDGLLGEDADESSGANTSGEGDQNALLFGGDDLLGDPDVGGSDAGELGQELLTSPLSKLKGSTHVQAGGWYLDGELCALRYMPSGHADKTLAAWAQFAHLLDERAFHADNANRDSMIGSCLECHQLQGGLNATWDDWKVVTMPPGVKRFTKFNHEPHLTLPAVSDCRYCHVLSNDENRLGLADTRPVYLTDADASGTTADAQRVSWHEDFVSMRREQCAACHRQGAAADSCTTCHNYHVGDAGFEWSKLDEP